MLKNFHIKKLFCFQRVYPPDLPWDPLKILPPVQSQYSLLFSPSHFSFGSQSGIHKIKHIKQKSTDE